MDTENLKSCTAFAGTQKIAQGNVPTVATAVKRYMDQNPNETFLIFDDESAAAVELDLRGTEDDVLGRLGPSPAETQGKAGPGRPKLGVVSREIGLLPRHWEWLALQPGGASVTLRKLVEEAKKKNIGKDAVRQSQNAAYKFMSAMAGDLPHFKEATRAFFAKNRALFVTLSAGWPQDIRAYALMLGAAALGEEK